MINNRFTNYASIIAGLFFCSAGVTMAESATEQSLKSHSTAHKLIPSRSRAITAAIPNQASDKKLGAGLSSNLNKRSATIDRFQSKTNSAGELQIVIELNEISPQIVAELRSYGVTIEVENSELMMIQGRAVEADFDQIASLSFVEKIRLPRYATPRAGSVNTQGDSILKANQLRALGFKGKGVKVGIISDGANNWTSARASGDLPASISLYGSCSVSTRNVSQCRSGKTCNEGTAMAEIIHDLAPEAQIAVGAVSTALEFIQRVNQLAYSFKADVIVDDLGFFGEPYFEDGDLANAVAALPSNVLYVSSAGNASHIHYEDDFKVASSTPVITHDFSSNDETLGFLVPADGYTVAILQWNDLFDNPSSDFDLYVTDSSSIVAASQANQSSGNIEPIEAVCIPNTGSSEQVRFAIIEKVSGADKRLEMFFLGSSLIEHNTSAGSIFGHAATSRALAIGSINASEPGNNSLAFYSSRGPSRVDFPFLEQRPKPDLVAIDGVSVTGAGGFPQQFFGTSAAAPHVAGIAALLFSVSDKVTAKNVKKALLDGAVDLGSAGADSLYGHGRVNAIQAKQRLREGDVALPWLMMLLEETL